MSLTIRGRDVSTHGAFTEAKALRRRGVNFYSLRYTVETIGGEARDQVALDAILGHARADIAPVYRERISEERLCAVTDQVRQWLFGSTEVA